MRTSDRSTSYFYQYLKIFPLLWGIFTIHSIFQALDISERQANWVTAQAVVTQSKNSFHDDVKRCHFRYKYVVNEQPFSNWRYSAAGEKCTGTAKFRQDDAIDIYYNPDQPASSVVERVPPSVWFLASSGIGSFIAISTSLYAIALPIVTRLNSQRAANDTQKTS